MKELALQAVTLNSMPQVATPLSSGMKLYKHQKLGLGRLFQWFDDESMNDGILADDMGLGRTAQIIALLLGRLPQEERPALVIVPSILMRNWKNEFDRMAKGSLFQVLYIHNLQDFATCKKQVSLEITR